MESDIVSIVPTDILAMPGSDVWLLVDAADSEVCGKILEGIGCLEGVAQVWFVGEGAEALHDQVDWLLESSGETEVVTAWVEDARDGVQEFLDASVGQKRRIAMHRARFDVLVTDGDEEGDGEAD